MLLNVSHINMNFKNIARGLEGGGGHHYLVISKIKKIIRMDHSYAKA